MGEPFEVTESGAIVRLDLRGAAQPGSIKRLLRYAFQQAERRSHDPNGAVDDRSGARFFFVEHRRLVRVARSRYILTKIALRQCCRVYGVPFSTDGLDVCEARLYLPE